MTDPHHKAPQQTAGTLRWWLLAAGIAVALFIALAILPHFFTPGPAAYATPLRPAEARMEQLIRLLQPLLALLR